jgi:hypothetical protein
VNAEQSLRVVFTHSCESSRLPQILFSHRLSGALTGSVESTFVCAVGDFSFTSGSVYVGLFPHPGVNKLWIVDSQKLLSSETPPDFVAKIEVQPEELVVELSPTESARFPLRGRDEVTLTLRIAAGQLTILRGSNGALLIAKPITFRNGLQLVIPSTEQSCRPKADGPDPCGLSLFDLSLDDREASRWAKNLAKRGRARK